MWRDKVSFGSAVKSTCLRPERLFTLWKLSPLVGRKLSLSKDHCMYEYDDWYIGSWRVYVCYTIGRGGWTPGHCTKCNHPPGQCTNFFLSVISDTNVWGKLYKSNRRSNTDEIVARDIVVLAYCTRTCTLYLYLYLYYVVHVTSI